MTETILEIIIMVVDRTGYIKTSNSETKTYPLLYFPIKHGLPVIFTVYNAQSGSL